MDETERVYFTQTEKEVSIFFLVGGAIKSFYQTITYVLLNQGSNPESIKIVFTKMENNKVLVRFYGRKMD